MAAKFPENRVYNYCKKKFCDDDRVNIIMDKAVRIIDLPFIILFAISPFSRRTLDLRIVSIYNKNIN